MPDTAAAQTPGISRPLLILAAAGGDRLEEHGGTVVRPQRHGSSKQKSAGVAACL